MRASATFCLVLLSMLLPRFSAGQTTYDISRAEAKAQQRQIAFAPSPATANYDLIYQRTQWHIDPAVRYIRGAVTSHFKPLTNALDQLWFDMDDALRVDSVYYRQQKINFLQSSEKLLMLDLPTSLAAGLLDSVTVFYQGTPPTTGYGSFEKSSHNGSPIIWTLSEPYGARDWWPCKQSLTDKIDSIDIFIRTPVGNKAASNGVLVAEQTTGNEVTYHWRHRYPIATYLVALAVTNYVAFVNEVPVAGHPPIEVLNYVYPESESALRPQAENIAGMMQLFSELFGLYPFADEKYGHAQFGWPGGMEHQTMSFMGSFDYDLMAHELAHQWFGDKVTCGSWHDIWVNEGFATYLTGLTKEHLMDPVAWSSWKQAVINSVTSQPGGSVWVPDTTNVNRIFSSRLSYKKGAYLLHMLRWVVGDEDFYAGIRNYLSDPALAYAFATAEDVKRHLEATSGKDLDEFFEDWYYGEGYPSYSVRAVQEQNLLTLTLNQATSVPTSVNFYEMPVPVYLRNRTGTRDTTLVLSHTHQDQTFTAELDFAVATIRVDPDLWLLSKGNTATITVVQPPPPTGLDEELQAKLKLFPNPAENKLQVQAAEGLQLHRIIATDLQGQQLFTSDAKGKNILELQVKQLPAGTYILRIQTNKGWVSKKFNKQ